MKLLQDFDSLFEVADELAPTIFQFKYALCIRQFALGSKNSENGKYYCTADILFDRF